MKAPEPIHPPNRSGGQAPLRTGLAASLLLHALAALALLLPGSPRLVVPVEPPGVSLVFSLPSSPEAVSDPSDTPPTETPRAQPQPPQPQPAQAQAAPPAEPVPPAQPTNLEPPARPAEPPLQPDQSATLPLPPPPPPPPPDLPRVAALDAAPPVPRQAPATAPATQEPTEPFATAASGIGTTSRAARVAPGFTNAAPPYPEESRLRNEQGTVRIRVTVDAIGRPAALRIAQSSGFPRLDRDALRAIADWRFDPALIQGVPTPSDITVELTYRLSEPD